MELDLVFNPNPSKSAKDLHKEIFKRTPQTGMCFEPPKTLNPKFLHGIVHKHGARPSRFIEVAALQEL